MQFSNTTDTSLGLVQDARWLVGADANNWPIADVTRRINRWLYRAVLAIGEALDDWEWDDPNRSGFPVATATLVNAQEDYSIPSDAVKVLRVEVKDGGGNWKLLRPIDETQIKIALGEFFKTAGLPKYYRALRRSLVLYPKPDNGVSVTLADGLKLYYLREPDEFTTTDTTQEPGFEEQFHQILSLGAASDFASVKGLPQATTLRADAEAMLGRLRSFYASRHRDYRANRIRPAKMQFI